MITVVIPTLDSEHLLVPTLAALVQGSAEGLVREVLLADGGSVDATSTIADAAGCEIVPGPPDEGSRLSAAAERARGEWLLFLDPGAVLDEIWTREVGAFVGGRHASHDRVATFRLVIDSEGTISRLREAVAATRFILLGRPRPEQGLLIARKFYRAIGGHSPGRGSRDRLLRSIGRGRFTTMLTHITLPGKLVDSVK